MGWTILGIVFMIWLLSPVKKQPKQTRHTTTIYKTIDPIRVQREMERQEDRKRRIAEQDRKSAIAEQKEKERQLKRSATATAENAIAKQNLILCRQYVEYLDSLKNELNDSDISITRQNQVRKEILRVQEKIISYTNKADIAHYKSRAYNLDKSRE